MLYESLAGSRSRGIGGDGLLCRRASLSGEGTSLLLGLWSVVQRVR